MSRIVIVGGGWAGLAAAVELTHQGFPVTVVESSKTCGGRARRINYRNRSFDNGQHLLIGGYHETIRLLEICGVDPEQQFQRSPLHFTFYGAGIHGEGQRSIKLPRLPAPFHMASGILQASGMGWSTKYQLLSASLRFFIKRFKLKNDCSVDELLQQAGQQPNTIKALWEPLCIATLNTPTHLASAEIFLRVLKEAFSRSNRDSDTLLYKVDLSRLFVEPAIDFIRAHGGEVLTSTRVKEIELDNNGVAGVITDTSTIKAQNVILATPPSQTAHLLKSQIQQYPKLQPLAEALKQFTYQPIITLYIQYDESACLPHPFVGFDNSLTQWLFDLGLSKQPGLMAAIISAEGEHSRWSREEITLKVTQEISNHFPELGEPVDSWLIHEKRATFSSTVGINRIRPANQTSIDGLWLAGDYTATGYPATLEGAVISGVTTSHGIISRNIRK